MRHHDWAAHNLLNTQYQLSTTPYGQMSSYWGMHTFHTLMPPSVYFKDHPEYYSVYKGSRSDKAQLCLSNSDMRRELTRNLLDVIAKNPGYWCYDVSQNDNSWPCECRSCLRLVRKYGAREDASAPQRGRAPLRHRVLHGPSPGGLRAEPQLPV